MSKGGGTMELYRTDFNFTIGKKTYTINQKALLEEIKFILECIAKAQKRPLHINSILMTINYMPEFNEPKVPYELYSPDRARVLKLFENMIRKRAELPIKCGIHKTYIAAFIASLDDTLVSREKPPQDKPKTRKKRS
jgi:hypothetical protein